MQGKKVSKPIVRISIISIALAIIVNLITIAVVSGFQQEVRQKVSGFGSQFFIMEASESSVYEAQAILKNDQLINTVRSIDGVKTISGVAYKPVLLQSEKTILDYQLSNGKDTSEVLQSVSGAIIKGVDSTYDLGFFKENLIEGQLPNLSESSTEILISKKIANDLHFKLNDTIDSYFVRNLPIKRKFIVSGIYNTGLEEFDKKIIIGPISIVQELNDWGIKASIRLADTLYNNQLLLYADVEGGNGNYKFDWGKGFDTYRAITIRPNQDTTIRLIAGDYWSNIRSTSENNSIPDTAYIHLKFDPPVNSSNVYKTTEKNTLKKKYIKDAVIIQQSNSNVTISYEDGKGSFNHYVGGYEITITDWNQLDFVAKKLKDKIEFKPDENGDILKVQSIKESEQDIFVWLDFLDINVVIILVLMILIGIINMGSALLVLILVRTNFIGMMKALGATNWSIRKIFLYQSAFLIGKGMFWGNVIGLGLCFLQSQFGLFKLNAEVYYLSEVPINLSILNWALLNLATLIVCLSALIVPSVVISRISPVKSIKFN